MMEPVITKVNYEGKALLEQYNNNEFSQMEIDEIYSIFKQVKKA